MPYLFLAPAITCIILFYFTPAFLSFVGSFFEIPLAPGTRWEWVGLDNYKALVQDPNVLQAWRNTMLYCALTIGSSLVLGLALALLVHGLRHTSTLVRMALFLPMTANLVAMAVVFKWIFALRGGLANQLLAYAGLAPVNWLNDTKYSLLSVAAVGIWRGVSLTMLIFLAGLTTIPSGIHEAAAAEGVRGWVKLRRITLPLIRPTTVFAVVLSIVTSVQVFDQVNVMTQGGPEGSSETVLSMAWKLGFGYFQLGEAAAMSFLLITLLILVGLLRRTSLSEQRS